MRTFGASFSGGSILLPQSSHWHQLIYASQGVMTVRTAAGLWVLPSHRAVWVPGSTQYAIDLCGPVSLRTLYLRTELTGNLPAGCCTMNVPPLLRELILHTVRLGALDGEIPEQARMASVLVDQLRAMASIPLQLPMPSDPRAVRVAAMLQNEPNRTRPFPELARAAGASVRTLERLFLAETQMTLGKWRQRLRVLQALRLLAKGEPVTAAALEAGYDSTSAFIAMFRAETGTTPGRYFEKAE
ncbi:MAG: helix-turn-helix transcriptional regulator [Bryobacteraceae bacterium]